MDLSLKVDRAVGHVLHAKARLVGVTGYHVLGAHAAAGALWLTCVHIKNRPVPDVLPSIDRDTR